MTVELVELVPDKRRSEKIVYLQELLVGESELFKALVPYDLRSRFQNTNVLYNLVQAKVDDAKNFSLCDIIQDLLEDFRVFNQRQMRTIELFFREYLELL